jgi:ABC-type bacteriocin/lantibiotic exporter with double-glycine peptidase domain
VTGVQTCALPIFVANRSVETFAQSLIAVGYVAIMAIVSLPLAAVFVVLSGIGFVGSLRSAERLERAVGGWLAARDRRFEHIVECVTSLLTIRTLGAHRGVERPFAAAQAREQAALADFRLGVAVADVWARAWAILVPTLGALVGVAFMWQGRITAGDVVVFLSLSGGLSSASIALFEGARRFHEARASLDRLGRATECEPDVPVDAPPARPRRVSGLVGAGLTVVHEAAAAPTFADLSLTLAPGEHVAVIGRSGGGKTTLALALARLLASRDGRVEIAGEVLPLADHRATVVLVPHQVPIWSADIRDNVTLWDPSARDEDVHAALAAAGLGGFVDGLDRGLDTTLGSRGVQLSAGQRQRLGLARVFLVNPPMVILDEATSALDPTTEAFVLANLRRVMRGRTLVVVTHREAVAATFDRVLRLEDGVLQPVAGDAGRADGPVASEAEGP